MPSHFQSWLSSRVDVSAKGRRFLGTDPQMVRPDFSRKLKPHGHIQLGLRAPPRGRWGGVSEEYWRRSRSVGGKTYKTSGTLGGVLPRHLKEHAPGGSKHPDVVGKSIGEGERLCPSFGGFQRQLLLHCPHLFVFEEDYQRSPQVTVAAQEWAHDLRQGLRGKSLLYQCHQRYHQLWF